MTKHIDPKTLAKTVAVLRGRIQTDRSYIARHETRTRVVLIDPLLRALGWDPEDSSRVHLEYETAAGKPDYALMQGGNPVAIVEAKRLGSNLGAQNPGQVIKYTSDSKLSGCKVVAFTNGDDWTFFRASNNWDPEKVKVSSPETFETAYDLARRFDGLRAERKAEVPAEHQSEPSASVGQATGRTQSEWLPINSDLPHEQSPTGIRFPDGTSKTATRWSEIMADVARHLYDMKSFASSQVPIVAPNSSRYLVANSPVHSNGTRFGNPKEFADGVWVEGHGGRGEIPRRCVYLLETCGVDPSTVQLRFD